jgi:hypothetical protein
VDEAVKYPEWIGASTMIEGVEAPNIEIKIKD